MLFYLIGCNNNPDSLEQNLHYERLNTLFGVSQNNLRLKHNRPLVSTDWVITESTDNSVKFAIGREIFSNKGVVMKEVFFDNQNEIIREIDTYYSGDIVYCIELSKDHNKFIDVSYSYLKNSIIDWDYLCCEECMESYHKFPKTVDVAKRVKFVLDMWDL
jgi:hypothetical protein